MNKDRARNVLLNDADTFQANSQNLSKRLFASFVSLSVLMQQLGSHWTDFNGILYWNIFRKFVENV